MVASAAAGLQFVNPKQGTRSARTDERGTLAAFSSADAGATAPLPHPGNEGAAAAALVVSLSKGRVLAGLDDGRLLMLSLDDDPATLLNGEFAGATGACISDDEASLFFCAGGGLRRCDLDVDAGTCSAPEAVALEVGAPLTAAVVDSDSNFYVGTAEGVTVFNPEGEPVARVALPSPVTGICFGGPSLTELYITATDMVWKLPTNSKGVNPPSTEFMKTMDRMSLSDGTFLHVGW